MCELSILGPHEFAALSKEPFLQITQGMSTIKKKKHFGEFTMSETVFKKIFIQHKMNISAISKVV